MKGLKQLIGAAGILLFTTGVASAYSAVAVTDLNVRSGQSTRYPIIGVLPQGSVVDVSGCGDGWCYVRNYGGYASASYLDAGGYAAAAPGVTFSYETPRRPYWRHRHHWRNRYHWR